MSNIWMGQVTHMNRSCHTYEWAMSHIWIRRVQHMCGINVVAHIGTYRGTYVSHVPCESCATTWVRHVPYMCHKRAIYVSRTGHVSHVPCESCAIHVPRHECVMCHICVTNGPYMCHERAVSHMNVLCHTTVHVVACHVCILVCHVCMIDSTNQSE